MGDVAYPVKKADPDLAAKLDQMEALHMESRGLDVVYLDERDHRKLRMCDRIDAVLWMMRCEPRLAETPQWQSDIAFCRSEAAALGTQCPV